MMVPVRCLQTNKERAHRICQNCWWDPETGFGRENAQHGCPGCAKGMPLNPQVNFDEIIELSDDDENDYNTA